MKIYLVGGAVRDSLRGVTPHDHDYVVTGSTIEEMLKLQYKQVGKDFPVFLHPVTMDEYALARTEVKTGNKHTDFKFDFNPSVTLREDAERRDFTINSLYIDTEDGRVIDYFNGVQDLHNHLLRHINSDKFIQDPLRVLRACRFAAQLDFIIAEDTILLCRNMVEQGMLDHLTQERVMHEIMKALETPRFDVFIYYMEVMGALEVVLPEVHALVSVPEKIEYHPEGTTFKHLLLTLSSVRDLTEKLSYSSELNEFLYKPFSEGEIEIKGGLSPKLLSLLNFGLLCHDLGKAKTPEDVIPSHIKHEINGVPIVKELCTRLKFPSKYLEFGTICCKYHMRFYNYLESHKSKHYDLIDNITKFLPENSWKLRLLLFVHWCDVFGREAFPLTERVEYLEEVMKLINLEYGVMLGVTLENLPNSTQDRLNKYSGVKFGKLYRDEMINYFKKVTAK